MTRAMQVRKCKDEVMYGIYRSKPNELPWFS